MRIVDIRRFSGPYKPPFDYIYCGPAVRGRYARAASALANPFHARPGDAEEIRISLDLYRKWLWSRIHVGDAAVLTALREIKEDSILGGKTVDLEGDVVYTSPEVCHTQIAAKAARWLRSHESRNERDIGKTQSKT